MEIANAEQAAAWNGHEGDHWTQHADRYDRASRRHWRRFVDAGLISSSDVVLDVGCGTGKSTREAARIASQGSVLGIDLSAAMLERARERSRADGLANVTFVQGDAQVHPFDERGADIAMSCFGAMFFGDPVAAFTNIGGGVRAGGRLALLTWRELARNEWLMALREALAVGRQLPVPPPDAPTPFALADPERVRTILGAAGYQEIGFEPIDEPIEFGSDADDAFAFMRTLGIVEGLTHDLDEAGRAHALAELQQTATAHDSGDGVLFGTSAWLITARRA
ncbi:MAG: methyltransferase domain-containing protein [Actinomycetota bacterium]|nr:methyltransferase domain-containing protein [Acidimicrobiia bacterium]MDQ3146718.1 methyltransferase domain-containing protein [Actinomycetota bacterium]